MNTGIQKEFITLAAVQTVETVKRLHEEVRYHFNRPGPILIDASQVESIDTASLQLLVILFLSSRQLTKTISIHDASAGFSEACRLLGLTRFFAMTAE